MASAHIDVQVSLRRFAANVASLRDRVRPARLCVVLKSDAYGHGLDRLAPVAAEAGADALGICTNEEARAIREAGIGVPILRLRMASRAELEETRTLAIEEQIGTLDTARAISKAAERNAATISVHLNIDSGMGRSGFREENLALARQTLDLPGLRIVGAMTHFAAADAPDLVSTRQQIARFDDALRAIEAELPDDILVHTHNSAAEARIPEQRRDMVRLRAACFGVRTSSEFENIAGLRPVMSVRTEIAELRDVPAGSSIGYGSRFTTTSPSRIAALPMGFGDGYPRSLFNKGDVLVHGQRCPVVGRVSLNITTVDVSGLATSASVGDEVVLVGEQAEDEITFEELADRWDSVHTEMNLMAGRYNRIRYVD